MKPKLNWQMFVITERHQAIESIKEAISDHEGCIINFTMFSDLALSLSIEVPEKQIQTLYISLQNLGNVSGFPDQVLNATSVKEWLLFLNISFAKGAGTLTIEMPEVPG